MKIVSEYPDGLFSWVDLTSTNIEVTKAFYTALFGWDAADLDDGEGNYIYTMFTIDGHNVAGMGEMQPEMSAQGIPSHWSSYINHSDVDGVVAKAAEAGGQVVLPPMDVMESGRMTMIQDPTGAIFGVWQPNQHIGAAVVNQPNSLVWNELQTNDLDGARSFYKAVFGWESEQDETGYVACSNNGRVQAGMMTIDENWGDVPPNWSAYFMVEDVNAAVEKIKELGGNILNGPFPAGEMGELAVAQDPAGAVFNIMQFKGPVDEPPGHG